MGKILFFILMVLGSGAWAHEYTCVSRDPAQSLNLHMVFSKDKALIDATIVYKGRSFASNTLNEQLKNPDSRLAIFETWDIYGEKGFEADISLPQIAALDLIVRDVTSSGIEGTGGLFSSAPMEPVSIKCVYNSAN